MLDPKTKKEKNSSGRIVRSSFTAQGRTKEIILGTDMTKPNMTKSLRELLVRHTNGITDNVDRQLSYSGDLPDLRNLDLHEIDRNIEIARQNAREAEKRSEEIAIQYNQEMYKRRLERDKKRFEEYTKNQQK